MTNAPSNTVAITEAVAANSTRRRGETDRFQRDEGRYPLL